MATIADRLCTVRRQMEMSQQDVADKSGVSQHVISKIENGRSLRPRALEAIAETLKVNPAWLQFGTPFALRDPQALEEFLNILNAYFAYDPDPVSEAWHRMHIRAKNALAMANSSRPALPRKQAS